MKTLSFAVVIATMVTASHAEPLEDYLRTLRGEGVSGLHDATTQIHDRSPLYDGCAHTAFGRNGVAMADAYFACIEAERTRVLD